MAYDSAYLGNLPYAGSKGAGQAYVLDTVDSDALVLGIGYISDGRLRGMSKGDPVLVRFYDTLPAKTTYLGSKWMSVSAINATTGVATLTGEAEPFAATATVDGLTTGLIPAGAGFVSITSAGAGNFINLPTPYAGLVIEGAVAATGCKVRGGAGMTTNAVANPAAVTLAANSYFRAVGLSATEWFVRTSTKAGAWTAADTAA